MTIEMISIGMMAEDGQSLDNRHRGVTEMCRITEWFKQLPAGSVRVSRAEVRANRGRDQIVSLIGFRVNGVDERLTAEYGPVLRP